MCLMRRATKSNGGIIVTVPQHRFMWSQQDDYACHRRRYETKELKRKVEAAGFQILRSSSFVSLLLPLMMASRLTKSNHPETYDGMAELRIGGLANMLLEKTMDVERLLIEA